MIAERLSELRKEKGYTQLQLAERAGLCLNCIKSIERGRRQQPRLGTLNRLAAALNVQVGRLME